MRLFVCTFLIAALTIDFIYTGVFWLAHGSSRHRWLWLVLGPRPHPWYRYLALGTWMSAEAGAVACLVAYLIR